MHTTLRIISFITWGLPNGRLWNLVLITFVLAGCRPLNEKQSTRDLSLVVTNVNYPGGESAWVIQNTNGISVSMQNNKVVVYFAIDSSMTLECDSRTRAITNLILEKPARSGDPGEYIFDFNGDGIPDERRIKTAKGNELFYRGKWYRYKPIGTNIALADVDGISLRMVFNGAQWTTLINK